VKQKSLKVAEEEASCLLAAIDSNAVSTNKWVKAHLETARLYNKLGDLDTTLRLLMNLRHVLPPLDMQQVANFSLPAEIRSGVDRRDTLNKMTEGRNLDIVEEMSDEIDLTQHISQMCDEERPTEVRQSVISDMDILRDQDESPREGKKLNSKQPA